MCIRGEETPNRNKSTWNTEKATAQRRDDYYRDGTERVRFAERPGDRCVIGVRKLGWFTFRGGNHVFLISVVLVTFNCNVIL